MNEKQIYTLRFEKLKRIILEKNLHKPTPIYGLRNIFFAIAAFVAGLLLLQVLPVWIMIFWFYIVIIELGYISHDLLHQQYFSNPKFNTIASYITANTCIGLSRSWWIKKHNQEHHSFTNSDIHDSDIRDYDEIFTGRPGKFPLFHRYKKTLFWVATSLLYYNLVVLSLKHIFRERLYLEGVLSLIGLLVLPISFCFQYGISVGILAIVGIYILVGVHLAFAFMVNHIGMPVIDGNTIKEYAWLHLQTLTSRNVSGGWAIFHIFGGLDKQIEHHLFPRASRANLREIAKITSEFCRTNGILYHQVSFAESIKEISRTLDTGETVYSTQLTKHIP